MSVANPYFIHLQLFWPDGTRPTQNQIARVNAYDVHNGVITVQGQSGYDEQTGGWRDLYLQNLSFHPPRLHPNLRFEVVSVSEQVVHTTQVFMEIPSESTVKIVIGQSDEIIGGDNGGGTSWTVSGTVRADDGQLVTSGTVKVYDVTSGSSVVLGESAVDGSGQYSVTFPSSAFENNGAEHSVPNLVVKYYDEAGVLLAQAVPSGPVETQTTIDVTVGDVTQVGDRRVFGDVTNTLALPVSGVVVEAWHLAWTTTGIAEVFLGRALSNGRGAYEIQYTAQAAEDPTAPCAGQAPGAVNLLVYAKEGTLAEPGAELTKSEPVFDAPALVRQDLTVDAVSVTLDSEYTRVHEKVAGCLGPDEATQNATLESLDERSDYLNFVAKAAGVTVELLQAYVRARRIAGRINEAIDWQPPFDDFDPEVIYALIRAGHGTELEQLLSLEPTEFFDVLVDAIDGRTIRATLEERLSPDAESPIQEQWAEVLAHFLSTTGDAWQNQLLSVVLNTAAFMQGDTTEEEAKQLAQEKRAEVSRRYYEFAGPFDEFIAVLVQDEVLSEPQGEDLLFVFEVYEAVDQYLPIVKLLYSYKSAREWEKAADLASVPLQGSTPETVTNNWIYYAENHVSYNAGKFPGDIAGKSNAEKARVYGQKLYDIFGAQAPEQRYTSEVTQAAAASGDTELSAVATFLAEHPQFELAATPVDKFIEDEGLTVDPAVVSRLKQLQRVSRLSPKYAVAEALVAAGYDSAVKIAQVDEADFIVEMEEAIGLTDSRAVHRKAKHYASEVFSALLRAHQKVADDESVAMVPASASLTALSAQVAAVGDKFPTWVTLFGALNSCASKHCQTVLSPGAYLADLLKFISGAPQNLLLARRPDLVDIEITCPNTDRVLPYIDLVIETLEGVVASHTVPRAGAGPFTRQTLDDAIDVTESGNSARQAVIAAFEEAGYRLSERAVVRRSVLDGPGGDRQWVLEDDAWRFHIVQPAGQPNSAIVANGTPQTSETATDLDVFPEHENPGAAAKLEAAIFPFQLPLALGREEMDLLLSQRGVSRAELLAAFRTGRTETDTQTDELSAFADPSIALAYLNLTPAEEAAILNRDEDPFLYWGLQPEGSQTLPRPESPQETVSGTWLELLSEVSIFLHRSQLSYAQLLELVDTDYIVGEGGGISIVAEPEHQLNCNYHRFRLANLYESLAGRINVFLRLRRMLGWEMAELDRYMRLIHGQFVVPETLTVLSQFVRLSKEWKLSRDEALVLLRNLDLRRTERHPRSQFDGFFKKGSPTTPEYAAIERLGKGQLSVEIDEPPISSQPDAPLTSTEGFKTHIRSALRINATEMDALWSLVVTGTELNVAQLSLMGRIQVLCRALGITVQEYIALFDTSQGEGLLQIAAFAASTDVQLRLDALFAARRATVRLKESGLSVAAYNYLLRDYDLEGQSYSPAPGVALELHTLMSTAAREVAASYPDTDVPGAEELAQLLGEVVPDTRVPRLVEVLRREQGVDASADDEAYFRRYLSSALGAETDGLLAQLLFDAAQPEAQQLDEAGRHAVLWRALRPELVSTAKVAAALRVASTITGAAADRVQRLLGSVLSSMAGAEEAALEDWVFGLGGYANGDAVVDRRTVTEGTTWASGWLLPADGRYRFVVVVHSTDAGSEAGVSLSVAGVGVSADTIEQRDGRTYLSFPLLPESSTNTVVQFSLSYDGPHPISMMVQKDNDDPRLLAAGELSAFDFAAYIKLHKALLLIEGLRLDDTELLYLSERFEILDQLPQGTAPRVPWASIVPFLDELRDNRSLALDETSLFEELLSEPNWPAGQVWTNARVARLTGWKESLVATLRQELWNAEPSLSLVNTWHVLRRCVALLDRVDLSAEQVLRLIVTNEPTRQRAAVLRDALRAHYSDETWSRLFKPLRDRLRQKHRDALVGFLTSRETSVGGAPRSFIDANDLFSYFLIDVEMEPDVQISRLKLALNVVQLFVQRAFMGLEGDTALYEVERKKRQWTWMKNYRVWEANRKVFLYPENWIEPELRDDKTELFSTLEEELLQDDVTPERATELLVHYVEGLDELSKLLVVGACSEPVFANGKTQVLHIVGRTRATPHTYYHRTFEGRQFHDGVFTPWRKIPLEIEADSVAPVVVDGALHIAWPLVVEKEKVSDVDTEEGASPVVEIRFIWSKLVPETGKWSKPNASKKKLIDYEPQNLFHRDSTADGPNTNFYHFRTAAGADGSARFELIKTNDPTPIFPPYTGYVAPDVQRDTVFWSLWGQVFDTLEEIFRDQFDEAVARRNDENAYLRPHRLGVFTITPEGGDEVSIEKTSYPLTVALPRATTVVHNAAEKAWYEVDGEQPQNRYGLRGSSTLFSRFNDTHRTVATNLELFGTARHDPFFLETSRMSLFGVHRGARRVPGLSATVQRGVHFTTFNHPVIEDIKMHLRAKGPEGIMQRLVQALPKSDGRYYYNYSSNYLSTTAGSYASGYDNKYNYLGGLYLGYRIAGDTMARGVAQRDFEVEYRPTGAVQRWYPWPTVDFQYGTSLGVYNWELFFHVPLLIADRLSQQMRFEEAMKWYHFIFDPRQDLNTYEKSKSWVYRLPVGARYWNFLPFFANDEVDEDLLDVFGVTKGLNVEEKAELRAIISAWRDNPFNPHLIARQRVSAYQKATVMKYLDNLIAWADELFRRDTFESINEATQLYVLAAEILGDRPEIIEPLVKEPRYTYRELYAQRLDSFSNALVEVESLLVGNSENVSGTDVDRGSEDLDGIQNMSLQSLYFSVPRNTKLDGYWDTVQDRLFKIRNSMNIDGVKRTLALFAPPIDPGLLVRAAAAGVDLGAVLSQLNRPMPHYRFRVWNQKAMELITEVKAFGAALLSALEKRDAEELSLLRQGHEIRMLKLAKQVREEQVQEAEANIVALQASRELAQHRFEVYSMRQYMNAKEGLSIKLTDQAKALDIAAGSADTVAGVLGAIPQVAAGAFSATAEFGGQHLNSIFQAIASATRTASGAVRADGVKAGTMGGYDRRQEDWDLQEEQAALEIAQIDKQLLAAEVRAEISRKELANHEVQIEQSEEVQTFLQDKFSNKDLYQWMAKELTRTYRQVYSLAYDVAKTAERTYRFELGLKNSDFIQFGYMDGPQGLLAGERLGHDIKRMDIAYLENDKRELEISKPISLLSVNPGALQTLREAGACEFALPEVLFDLDFPGHYFRRIRAVRLTIPCVTGPYTSVSAKLSLLNSAIRTESTADPDDYPYRGFEDPRFVHSVGNIQSIATSTAQDDPGLFELNFRDERYLPFEGSGVISRWRLELPEAARQFDYHSISDVIINVSYTAREAGGSLKQGANNALLEALNSVLSQAVETSQETGLTRVLSMKREFPDALHQLLSPARAATLTLRPEHFPYLFRDQGYQLQPFQPEVNARVVTKEALDDDAQLGLQLNDETGTGLQGLAENSQIRNLIEVDLVRSDTTPIVAGWQPEHWHLTQDGLDSSTVDDVLFVVRYRLEATDATP